MTTFFEGTSHWGVQTDQAYEFDGFRTVAKDVSRGAEDRGVKRAAIRVRVALAWAAINPFRDTEQTQVTGALANDLVTTLDFERTHGGDSPSQMLARSLFDDMRVDVALVTDLSEIPSTLPRVLLPTAALLS